jgi:hypothetical protein
MGGMSDDDDELETEGAEEGQDHEDEELLAKLQSWEKQARQHWSTWRTESRRAYDFVAGNQWSQDDKAALLDQMRQPIVFNRTGPMVDAVLGAEILNRQEVRFVPREIGDVQVNEVISAANDWARDLCDAEDEESDAFSDVIVCGMGWTETRMDYEIDPEGTIRIDRIDPFEMWSDPSARKRNLADRQFCYRGRYRNRSDLPKEWKTKILSSGADGAEADAMMSRGQTGAGDDYENGDPEVSGEDQNKGKVWIKHFQWWELEEAFKISDEQSGQSATMEPEEYKQIVAQFIQVGMQPPPAVKLKVRKYYQAFVSGDVLLEPKSPIPCNQFTFNCITGKRDRNQGTWYGIVRAMMDPQMWANKWLSQILHILNTSSKGGVLHEEGAFVNERKALEDWGKPDSFIGVKRGQLAGIQEREAKAYPQGLDRLLEFAVGSMPQVTGINLELLGLVQKEQAGVLEAQRKQAGYAILAVFFDSLRRYRKMQGRIMLHFIQEYISDGRLIRIAGAESGAEQYVPLVKQGDTASYDVIVDEAPMSANQKEAVWGMMTQMLPILTKQPVPMQVWQEFLRYSPLPSSVSAKIGKALAEAGQPDPAQEQIQQAGQQLALRKEAATAAKDETQAVLNQARAVQATKQAYQQTLEPQQPPGNRQ